MFLFLNEENRNHLMFLKDLESEVVAEFCRISIESILKGPNSKVYYSAAQKLGTDEVTVQRAVEGLMNLYTEGAKHLLNEEHFQETTKTLGFTETAQEQIVRFYKENVTEIRSILSRMVADLPHYKNLEWRVDVQVASRSLHHQVTPLITMKLTTETKGNDPKAVYLQTDPTSLVHITRVLDDALQEVKSQHCRRIQRQIK